MATSAKGLPTPLGLPSNVSGTSTLGLYQPRALCAVAPHLLPGLRCEAQVPLTVLSLTIELPLVPSRGRHHRPYAPHHGHYTDTVHTTLPHAWPWARPSTSHPQGATPVPCLPQSTSRVPPPGRRPGGTHGPTLAAHTARPLGPE
eukprot:scaffold60147_cov55-Phaeocystis_antarctica.AAC.2